MSNGGPRKTDFAFDALQRVREQLVARLSRHEYLAEQGVQINTGLHDDAVGREFHAISARVYREIRLEVEEIFTETRGLLRDLECSRCPPPGPGVAA